MAVDLKAWNEAEVAVIGSLCIDPSCAGLVFRDARAAYFRDEALRHVFEAALRLWTDNRPLDAVTIHHAAGPEYKELIRECMTVTPTAANVKEYLRIMRSEYRVSAITDTAAGFLSIRTETEAVRVFEKLGTILRESDTVEDLGWAELVADYLQRMDSKAPNYLTWGFSQLDRQLSVVPGDFVVLGADSSVGKTALALQFAAHMALNKRRVLFVSLETSTEKLEDRLMAETQVAGIAMPRTKARALSSQDYERAVKAGTMKEPPYFRMIRRAETLEDIQSRIIMHRADVCFIDYLQIINIKAKSRYESVTEISMGLHRMAQRLGCTIVALSQVTPPEGDKELTMQDLRDSGQIKMDAEVVLLMSVDERVVPGGRQLVIAKDKDGARNKRMLLAFDPEHMSFKYAKRRDTDRPEEPQPPMFQDEAETTPFEH